MITLDILAVAAVVMLNVLAFNHAGSMLTFTSEGARTGAPESFSGVAKIAVLLRGVNIPRPVSSLSPLLLAADTKAITLTTDDGMTLGGWYCNRGPDTPLVILFHGYASEKSTLLDEARALLDLDASVLLIDFRGSGESSASYTTIGVDEALDVKAAFAYARSSLTHTRVILYGHSMGAAAILRAVAHEKVTPDAIIASAIFDSMLHAIRNRFRAMELPPSPGAELLVFWGSARLGFNGFAHKPVLDASAVTCPIVFLHGENDPRATLDEGRRVFDAVPSNKQFHTFSNGGHSSYLDQDRKLWLDAVSPMLAIHPIPAHDTE